MIQNSLRKSELNSLANNYKLNKYANIVLYYKNMSLNKDESSINDIMAGKEILYMKN